MKLLVNASTLSATGVTQVAVSFINECKNIKNVEFHVFLSSTVAIQLGSITNKFSNNIRFYLFDHHPLYGIKGYMIRKEMRNLEREIKPDVVFSVFGPSWWTPKAPHLIGFAYPYIIYPESPFFNKISNLQKFRYACMKFIHVFFLRRNAKYFVSETEDSAKRLLKVLKLRDQRSFVVSNTCSNVFFENIVSKINFLPPRELNEFRFLSLCSLTLHKNLEILNEIIPLLVETAPDVKFKFILTIDNVGYYNIFSDFSRDYIVNLGRIDIINCPQLYREVDALFLPTLLECFSANYPEAMKMEKPILTSDLPFAKDVCQNAAMYVNPLEPDSIAKSMIMLSRNKDLRQELISNGRVRLNDFLSAKERAEKYIKICKDIMTENSLE